MQPVTRIVAVVGVGEMGLRHVRVFSAKRDARVVGVIDADPRRAEAAARRFNVAQFADEAEAIARADLVVVATPIGAHADTVERALAAKRHVLVEKPVCAHLVDAERLVALADRRGVGFFVGHSERFNPVVRALCNAVSPRDVRALELLRAGPPVSARGLRNDGGGVLLNLGVHDIDLAAYIARSPAVLRRAEGDDSRAQLMLALGPRGTGPFARIRVDRTAAARQRVIRVVTGDATFEGDLLAPRLVRRDTCGRVDELPIDLEEPLAAQAGAVIAALNGHASSVATGLDGMRALAIAERAAHVISGAHASRSWRAPRERHASPANPSAEKL